jgi:hypothetical protein
MAANQTANFVVKAKDAATGPLGKVGGSMGKLRRTAGTVFKAIGAAALIAGAALVGFAGKAIKAAVADERAAIRLNAALKARGFALDSITPKVDKQIQALQRLGFTDDDVKDGIEAGSRFIKDETDLLNANATAANIAAVTGKSLADVQMIIGRAMNGSTRGLVALGVKVEKGAKLTDILNAANENYAGTAEELARSTSGRFTEAQIRFNEAIETFGYDLLPVANEALGFLTDNVLPAFEDLMKELGPVVGNFIDEYVRPLVDTFAELFEVLSQGDVSIIDLLFVPLELILGSINALITGIVAGIKFIQGFGGAAALAAGSAARDYQTGGYARGDMGGQSSYLNTAQGLGTYVIPISIGTGKVDTVVADSIRRIGPGPRRGR